MEYFWTFFPVFLLLIFWFFVLKILVRLINAIIDYLNRH